MINKPQKQHREPVKPDFISQADWDKLRATEIAGNVASIRKVPARLIGDKERAEYIAYAEQGEDIYAYSNGSFWNLWWTDQRFELGEFTEGDEA